MRQLLLFLIATLFLVGCGGGGGGGTGGGGGGNNAFLIGRVLWVETNSATSPAASVSSGGNSTTTDIVDGSFVVPVPIGTSSLTVSYTETGSSTPVVMTFTFAPATGTVDVGDLYIGPETVTVHGTVEDASNSQPVSGATVKLAGRTATTDINGEFNLLEVAYSSTSPAAFGDIVGEVTKIGYVTRQFTPPTVAIAGVVEVGTLVISPESLDAPPGLPANLTGTILPVNDGAGSTVELLDAGLNVIRTVQANGAGQYAIWAPVGTFTVRATAGAKSGQESVTLTATNVQKVVNVTLNP